MSDEVCETTSIPRPSRRAWLRDLGLALVLFSCGAVAGGVGVTQYYAHRLARFQQNGMDMRRAFGRLQRSLDLTEEQSKDVQKILRDGVAELRGVRRSVRPRVEEIMERMRTDVASRLDERQKKIWEERFRKTAARWFPKTDDSDGSN
jgi:hypothetical protein